MHVHTIRLPTPCFLPRPLCFCPLLPLQAMPFPNQHDSSTKCTAPIHSSPLPNLLTAP